MEEQEKEKARHVKLCGALAGALEDSDHKEADRYRELLLRKPLDCDPRAIAEECGASEEWTAILASVALDGLAPKREPRRRELRAIPREPEPEHREPEPEHREPPHDGGGGVA